MVPTGSQPWISGLRVAKRVNFHEPMNSDILREAYLCPVLAGVHIFKLLGKDTEFQTKSIPSEHIISLQRIGR